VLKCPLFPHMLLGVMCTNLAISGGDGLSLFVLGVFRSCPLLGSKTC